MGREIERERSVGEEGGRGGEREKGERRGEKDSVVTHIIRLDNYLVDVGYAQETKAEQFRYNAK